MGGISAPARVPERGSTLQRASCCVMPRRATTSSPASLASPGRPVPPSIMPSRTNLQPGTCINRRAGPVFVWCGRISKSAAHDNGPLRCASRGGSLVTWDGRGHFTRPGIFYSGRPCLGVRVGRLGRFVKAFLALGGPGDWKSSMPAYLTDGNAAYYCYCLLFPVRFGTQNQRTCRLLITQFQIPPVPFIPPCRQSWSLGGLWLAWQDAHISNKRTEAQVREQERIVGRLHGTARYCTVVVPSAPQV